jgi:hypothetical protein
VHLPTGRSSIATLKSVRQGKPLISELVPVWTRDPEQVACVVERHLREDV